MRGCRDSLRPHFASLKPGPYEDKQLQEDLRRLTPEERALYDDLRDNRIRVGLRLEQEHIGFQWVEDWLRKLPGGDEIAP
ncbi:hypothetical protein FACS1894116_07580 [Betaproteobacteria bacterium]|nr:hypothetical protein FACS1894116_07580 [Betaproteobacteria bacterium]GHU25636.1 hypothetical protein FACS189488_13060 [Betaproteobacteria bacterium]